MKKLVYRISSYQWRQQNILQVLILGKFALPRCDKEGRMFLGIQPTTICQIELTSDKIRPKHSFVFRSYLREGTTRD